jgi:hypothetical protein
MKSLKARTGGMLFAAVIGLALAASSRDLRDDCRRVAVATVAVLCVQFGGLDPVSASLMGVMLATAPFPVQPTYTNIAIAYMNEAYIADAVLPRVPVGTQDFKYTKWTMAEGFTLPDTKVGRKGQPNEVEFTGTEASGSCVAFGLDDPVPQDDIDNAPPGYDPEAKAVERVTDLILLDREVRAAGQVFNTANFATGFKATLSGTGQWSDYTNSDPASAILTALDSCIIRPNRAVIGQAVYTKLRMHPKIVQAFYGNSATAGVVPKSFLEELLELDEILVGKGWVNSAKKGQTASLVRVWGKHAVFFYQNANADSQGGTTFGYTAQWGQRLAGSERDSKIGLRGGQRVRVGEYVKEVIAADNLGYMFENAVA